jgi:hypothetical protein
MPYTLNDTNCGSISYTITTSTGGSVDNSVITVDDTTPSISIYTSDSSKTGAYSLEITGTVSAYPTKTASVTFSLNVLDCCSGTTIISTSISDYTYYTASLSYDVISSLVWT